MTLLELQRLFKSDLQNATCGSKVHIRTGRYSVERRLEVYQYAVPARIKEAVWEDFPLLAKALPPEKLRSLMDGFFAERPSRFASLAEIGQELASYLAEGGDLAHAELARFEWSQVLSENAGRPGKFENIENLRESDLPSAELVLHPSVILFQSEYQVLGDLRLEKSFLLIRRQGDDIVTDELTEDIWRVFATLAEGENIFSALSRMDDPTPSKLQSLFFEWVRDGIIIGSRRRPNEAR